MPFSENNLKKIAFYEQHYQIAVKYPLIAKTRIKLRDSEEKNERKCRFCGKSKPEVSFRKKAHAIPEFLGNKSLISMNECDICNVFFASEYEDHLAKWFGPGRSLTRIRGKKGVPKFKTNDFRVEMGEKGLAFTITSDIEKMNLPEEGPFKFKIPVEMPTQPYIPIRAAQALIKAAISILPPELLSECEMLITWLLKRAKVTISKFPVLFSFTPGINPYASGEAMILKRKSDAQMPYLVFIVAMSNYRFQIILPFCKSDTWMSNGENTFTVMHFPIPFDIAYEKKYGKTKFYTDDWASKELVVQNRTGSFHVERAERIKMCESLPENLLICDLYPYECCAVKERYNRAKQKIIAEGCDPIEIMNLDGEYLVSNGCNRVKAMKDLGETEVPVKWASRKSKPEIKSFMEALEMNKGYKGFQDYNIVESDDEREHRTREQMKNYYGFDLSNPQGIEDSEDEL